MGLSLMKQPRKRHKKQTITEGDASVFELVIQHAERASELLMHVNIRGLRALLSRDGTHGFH